jgi:hypothetical protein
VFSIVYFSLARVENGPKLRFVFTEVFFNGKKGNLGVKKRHRGGKRNLHQKLGAR